MLVSFALGNANFSAFYLTRNLKVAFYPTRNPNASQWNIGCFGSLALGLCVGHVHFIFFVLISFALGSRRKHSFQWNMGLRVCSNKAHLAYFQVGCAGFTQTGRSCRPASAMCSTSARTTREGGGIGIDFCIPRIKRHL